MHTRLALRVLLIALASACGGSTLRETADVHRANRPGPPALSPRPPVAPLLTIGDDVMDRELTRNADGVRPPPNVFRAIPATAIAAGTQALPTVEAFAGGFRVRLPSGAPVVTPAIYGDMVVVGGGFRSREMYAFHRTSATPRWAISLGDDGPSTPACEDGVCVFNTESCTIFAVHAETGELLWSWYIGDPLMSAPAIANGLVFASYPIQGGGGWAPEETRPLPDGATHALAAFDLHSGELRWTRWVDADVISAPVAIVDMVYAATFAGTMYQFEQRSGTLVAARAAMATSAPAWIDGALYFTRRIIENGETFEQNIGLEAPPGAVPQQQASGGGSSKPWDGSRSGPQRRARYLDFDYQQQSNYAGESAANDAANGFSAGAPAAANAGAAQRLIGRNTVHGLQEYQGSWILGMGAANYTTMGADLVAYDRASGRERWSVTLPGDLQQQGGALGAPPAAAGGRLVVAALAGKLLVIEPGHGRVQRELETGAPLRTQAIVHDGWIYAGTTDGQLIALDTGDRSLTGWPTWAGNPARTGEAAN